MTLVSKNWLSAPTTVTTGRKHQRRSSSDRVIVEHEIVLLHPQHAYQMDSDWRPLIHTERLFSKGARGKLLECVKSAYKAIEFPGGYYIEGPYDHESFRTFRRLTPLEVLVEAFE